MNQALSFHACKLMSTIYVGSIPYVIQEQQIRQLFSTFGPIKYINMPWSHDTKTHKMFTFIEYDYPDAAYLALEAMQGYLIEGKQLKLNQCVSIQQAQHIVLQIIEKARQYFRVYFALAGELFSREAIQQSFQRFGKIIDIKLLKDSVGLNRVYGYITYATERDCIKVVRELNGLSINGSIMHVVRAITPPDLQERVERLIHLHASMNQMVVSPISHDNQPSLKSSNWLSIRVKLESKQDVQLSESTNQVEKGTQVEWIPGDDLAEIERLERMREDIYKEIKENLKPRVNQLIEMYKEKSHECDLLRMQIIQKLNKKTTRDVGVQIQFVSQLVLCKEFNPSSNASYDAPTLKRKRAVGKE